MGNELETKLKEYADLPAHILGLDGWLLRNIPVESRNAFLKGYEKLMRIAYFPDHAKSTEDKERRAQYIQAIAQAVSFLTSDEDMFDIAAEEVPSRQNPLSKLQKHVDRTRGEVEYLTRELVKAKGNLEEQRRISESLQRLKGLLRMKGYYDLHATNSDIFPLQPKGKLLLSGRRIDLGVGRESGGIKYDVFNEDDYKEAHRNFSKVLEKFYMKKVKERLMFRDTRIMDGNKEITLMGGLPLESIREYVIFSYLPESIGTDNLDARDFRRAFAALEFGGREHEREANEYQERVSPFLTPYVLLYSPVLLRERNLAAKPDEPNLKFRLFYPEGINPHLI